MAIPENLTSSNQDPSRQCHESDERYSGELCRRDDLRVVYSLSGNHWVLQYRMTGAQGSEPHWVSLALFPTSENLTTLANIWDEAGASAVLELAAAIKWNFAHDRSEKTM